MHKSDDGISQNSIKQNDRFLTLSADKIEHIEFGQFSQAGKVVGIYNYDEMLIRKVPDTLHYGEKVKVLLDSDIYIDCIVKYCPLFENPYLQSLENWD